MGLIIIGFLGVILIINPSSDGFNWYSVYALIAVASITLRDLLTRKYKPRIVRPKKGRGSYDRKKTKV